MLMMLSKKSGARLKIADSIQSDAFREIFGRTVIYGEDEMTLEAYIRTLETDSEFDIEYYCPEKGMLVPNSVRRYPL